MRKMTPRQLLTGPIFLLLYILVTPLQWVIMKLFVAVLKLHTWVCTNLNETLNLPDND